MQISAYAFYNLFHEFKYRRVVYWLCYPFLMWLQVHLISEIAFQRHGLEFFLELSDKFFSWPSHIVGRMGAPLTLCQECSQYSERICHSQLVGTCINKTNFSSYICLLVYFLILSICGFGLCLARALSATEICFTTIGIGLDMLGISLTAAGTIAYATWRRFAIEARAAN